MLKKYKITLLFFVLFLHVSLLDLFYVTTARVVFLWPENLNFETILVHLLIASLAVVCYFVVDFFRQNKVKKLIQVSDKFWLVCSLILACFIGYFLY